MDRKEIENLISDYHWRKREIERLNQVLYGIGKNMPAFTGNGVAQYGIEATMPKGSKGISQAELDALDRRERKILNKLNRYTFMVWAVEKDQELLSSDFHKTIYDCMMDGMSYRAIGKHLNISRGKLDAERNAILSTIIQKDQKSQIVLYLTEGQKNYTN